MFGDIPLSTKESVGEGDKYRSAGFVGRLQTEEAGVAVNNTCCLRNVQQQNQHEELKYGKVTRTSIIRTSIIGTEIWEGWENQILQELGRTDKNCL